MVSGTSLKEKVIFSMIEDNDDIILFLLMRFITLVKQPYFNWAGGAEGAIDVSKYFSLETGFSVVRGKKKLKIVIQDAYYY